MHNLRRKTFIQSSNNSNYLGCISILPRLQSRNTALLILSKTIEGLPHDTLFHSNSIFCFWSIQFKSGRDPACCTLSCLSDAILMRSKAKCHARLTVAHFAFLWRYSFSVHPSPSPRAISGYKDLRESPLHLTSGLHFLWFHIVTPCCSLIHLSMNLFPYFIHWVRLGYKCSRIFNSSDKGVTSPLLPASSDRFTYDSTYTCLSFLHFLFARFFGLAINSSEFLLRQYNVDSIFCFLSLLSLPDFVYTDSLLPVRSRIPQHLFACLLVTFFDLSPLVLSTKGSSS